MRRGFCATLLATCATIVLRNVCFGQPITFIPGLQAKVPNSPTYAAAADFNGDGIADAVVVSAVTPKVTVLFGAPPCPQNATNCQNQAGSFSSLIALNVGRLLRGVTTGDFNGDGLQDIAVTDFDLASVLVIYGKGDGTFVLPPSSFRVARRGPVAVTPGDFTGNFYDFPVNHRPVLDMVTANSFNNTITTLFNLGANRGFLAQPNIPAGSVPRALGAADFNSDGLDDIVVLNTGARGTDQLTIFLNNGIGSFQSVTPTNFVVGVGATALTVADFNDDGIPDVAVLNGGAVGSQLNTYSVSVLINQTAVTPEGKTVGTGFFTIEQTIPLSCPATIHGIPVNCTVQDIKSADFDGNGETDLAISFSTTAAATGSTTSGFVSAFEGRGDGTFDFATQIIVDLGPRQMAVADFTGDGSPDLAITESGNNTVRILRSVAPPPRNVGDSCKLGTQCLSGNCVNSTCCTTSSCPSGERCDVGPDTGVCTTPAANGTPCTDAAQCLSGFCVDNFCCGSSACASGLFCNTGACGGPARNGTPCSNDAGAQCDSGNCVDGFCCASASCAAGLACDIPGSEGQCTATTPNGTPCTDVAQCTSGNCVDNFCCLNSSCAAGKFCNTGQCQGPSANGTLCGRDEECDSGNCVDGVCCASAQCQAGQFCNILGSLGKCSTPGDIGTPCSNPAQCLSNLCVDGFCCTTGSCQAGDFCNSGQCAPPAINGTPCNSGAQCDSGNCVNGVCCASAQCQNLQSCNVPPNAGTCSAQLGLGAMCTSAAQCQSGFCTDSVCCNTSACPVGKVCGSSGACVVPPPPTATPPPTPTPTATPTPQPTGRPCIAGSQCISGNCVDSICCSLPFCPKDSACNVSGKEGQCAVVPTPTPTVQQEIGAPCNTDGQCLSSHCTDGACCLMKPCPSGELCNISGSAGTCTFPPPTPTPTPLPVGFACTDNTQCVSGICVTGVCCTTLCADGQACNVSGKVGQCETAPTPTITPIPTSTPIPLGAPCNSSNPGACVSGFCTDGVCCDSDGCPSSCVAAASSASSGCTQRCDIFGFEGSCSDQLNVDDACDKGTDCQSGLICSFSADVGFDTCGPPPSPTPTLFPLPASTPTTQVHLSVGGGCSIGGSADGAGLWLLAAVPFVSWLRNRLVRPRVRTHRRARPQ